MIAIDTNILVYAHRPEFSQYARARERLTALAEGSALWALPVFCLGEFIRITTHPRFLTPPSTLDESLAALSGLLESPSLSILVPGDRFWALFQAALRESRSTGNLAFDAQIVAVCREHGARPLLTEDRDFGRFKEFPVEALS
ncbi:MAG TPA: TA system VapC family ribonuclease toxin [bacterium]|nr:TA system VapC family ribonuclease toxin [bacterium]